MWMWLTKRVEAKANKPSTMRSDADIAAIYCICSSRKGVGYVIRRRNKAQVPAAAGSEADLDGKLERCI